MQIGGNESPDEGDLSVCYECGAFLTFDAFLQLRLLSAFEIAALSPRNLMGMTKIRMLITGA